MTHYTQRVLEGRQVRTLQDLMDYCEAALNAARVVDRNIEPEDIDLAVPHDMRLLSEQHGSFPDDSRIFTIAVQAW